MFVTIYGMLPISTAAAWACYTSAPVCSWAWARSFCFYSNQTFIDFNFWSLSCLYLSCFWFSVFMGITDFTFFFVYCAMPLYLFLSICTFNGSVEISPCNLMRVNFHHMAMMYISAYLPWSCPLFLLCSYHQLLLIQVSPKPLKMACANPFQIELNMIFRLCIPFIHQCAKTSSWWLQAVRTTKGPSAENSDLENDLSLNWKYDFSDNYQKGSVLQIQ